MFKLYGFAASNYYNKVKIALLEKGVPFEEELNWAVKDAGTFALSPFGKIPFVDTGHGGLCESQAILEYLEEAYPRPPLLPSDPYARAKVRELTMAIELYLELVARRLYPQAFFGRTVAPAQIEQARTELLRHVDGLARIARFDPYIAGSEFTMADCAAIVHLPVVTLTTRQMFGEDFLAGLPVRPYLDRMAERPSVRRVSADRKVNTEVMLKTAARPVEPL